jgi:hypothetical protein
MTSSNAVTGPEGCGEAAESKTSPQMQEHLANFVNSEAHDPEPTFTFRAQDALAVDAIWFYERMCDRAGLYDQAEEVRKAIEEIEHWQSRNPERVKNPDHDHQLVNRRNPHCNNCGDLRGGPMGHESSECTYKR